MSLLLSASILIIVQTVQPTVIMSRIGIQMKACTATRFEYCIAEVMGVDPFVAAPE